MDKQTFFSQLSSLYPADEISAMYRWLERDGIVPDETMVARLCQNEPLQYILGYTWFYNRKLEVSPYTLIPRPETEELCHLILNEAGPGNLSVWDIGTGSGCVAITIAAENKHANVLATDISLDALEVANKNITHYSLENQITTKQSDFLTDANFSKDLDIIVSNPPYVSIEEISSMHSRVTNWEPHLALFPAGNDPLVFYRRLAEILSLQINPQCVVWAEINAKYSSELQEIFSISGTCNILSDISGNPRFLRAKKEGC